MSVREVRLSLAVIECVHLAALIDQFAAAIAAADETPDPAVTRLTPDPYPEDATASAEFATATRDDLLDRRTADAAVVLRGLTPHLDSATADQPRSDLHAPGEVELVIGQGEVDAWLRTLTALRLVLATRLHVVDDGEHDHDDPRFGVYDWLAYRLEELIALADDLDEP